MNDRELLELAAKAAGLQIEYWGADNYPVVLDQEQMKYGWNPLVYDSDALRLAVKLMLNVDLAYGEECVVRVFNSTHFFKESTVGDAYAATRRAIVRAAAGIGKAMP